MSESGAPGTELTDYNITINCTKSEDTPVKSADGPSVSVSVSAGDNITCLISNSADARVRSVSPVLECVLFSDGQPDVA